MEYIDVRRIKMRHLSAFVETVRNGSMKAAAEQINLTQPAISKILRDLEEIVGSRLLLRGRGGIALTREGAVFRQFAEQSLASLSHGLASLDALNAGATVPLRIGALPSAAADLLPDAVLAFARLSPATPVSVEDGQIDAMLDRLRSGALDLVVGRMARPEVMSGLNFLQLYSEQVVFVAAPDHPLSECTDVRALTQFLLLYPPAGAAIRPLIDRFLIARGMGNLQNRIETVSGAFGRSMTLGASQAIWIISHGVVARDIDARRMIILPIDTTETAGAVGIMSRSDEDPSPPIRLFRQAILDSLESKER